MFITYFFFKDFWFKIFNWIKAWLGIWHNSSFKQSTARSIFFFFVKSIDFNCNFSFNTWCLSKWPWVRIYLLKFFFFYLQIIQQLLYCIVNLKQLHAWVGLKAMIAQHRYETAMKWITFNWNKTTKTKMAIKKINKENKKKLF